MIRRNALRVTAAVISVAGAVLALGLVFTSLPQAQARPQSQTWTWPGANCPTSLQACIDQAADGDTLDIVPGTYITSVTVNKSITLTSSMLTTTLYALSGQRVMTVAAPIVNPIAPQVAIENLTLTGGQLTTQTGCAGSCNGGGLLIMDRARVRLTQVTIASNQAVQGGGIYIDTGLVVFVSGSIYNNVATDFAPVIGNSGGGVYVADQLAIFQQDDGSIAFNSAVDGGGIFVQDGQFIQNGGEVSNNIASNWGGGLLVANNLSGAQLNAGQIVSNSAELQGGGVFVDSGQVTLVDTEIAANHVISLAGQGGGLALLQSAATVYQPAGMVVNNTAANGAGYYVAGGNVTLGAAAQISGNIAAESGGGLYVEGGGTVIQLGGIIGDNQASLLGGGVNLNGGKFILRGGDVAANSVGEGSCGGVAIDGGGDFQAWNGRVLSNTAISNGGGACVLTGTMTISGSVLLDNRAGQGGGVYVSGGQLFLRDGTIAGNLASTGQGGGVYVANATGLMEQTGGTVRDNQSITQNGGGLYLDSGAATIKGGSYINNYAASNGGAIASDLGALKVSGSVQILGNQAGLTYGNGGGLYVYSGTAEVLNGVVISGNTSLGQGGGLWSQAPVVITGVRFISNSASSDGGGMYLSGDSDSRVVNSVFARNTANTGAGLALDSRGQTTLLYLTLAYEAPAQVAAIQVNNGSVGMTDTIISTFTTGLAATAGTTVVEDYNLFYDTSISLTGVTVMGAHDLDGLDPQFVDPDHHMYRLPLGSPAVNNGLDVGVYTDLGGWPRPIGPGFDRGAFEVQALSLPITPNVGATLVYTSNTGTTTTVTLPPTLVTTATSMIFTNLVDLPTDTPPPSQFQFAGSVFEIEAFGPAGALPGITFAQPITIVIHYSDADVANLTEQTLKSIALRAFALRHWLVRHRGLSPA